MLIKRRKHRVPELNTTSTADISFMLLTFFLVTTSMDVDRGIVRQLPPLDDDEDADNVETKVDKQNTLAFHILPSGKITLNDKPVEVDKLHDDIANFITMRPKQHVIMLDADPKAGYKAYFALQNEIVLAYNKVRANMAQRLYHKPYEALTEEQRDNVRDLCPQRISETYNTYDNQASATDAQQKGGDK